VEGNHGAWGFSQFGGHLKVIAADLERLEIPDFYLDGSTPQKARGTLVNGFQNGEKPLFLISLKAGGSGLNLTGADYVFHMDPWWNPAVEDQASDRAHRIGQERPVTVYRLITAGSIEEQTFYEANRQQAVDRINETGAEEDQRFTILAEITRLRQACCHPKLIDPQTALGSAKLNLFGEKVVELIEGNHQALVFSQFVGHLKLIAAHLDRLKIPYFYLDGSTPQKARGALVNGFQNGEKPLFLISLKAGGSGLNLTGADYVFHMDPWWNPAVEDQASDRAHRIGQERPVTVYR
ncbi:MAG: SWF/SNF helicase family protein, partial [Planctomycetaceae bacterium]|nr:SWF/SNF helicase family protein [Planctomycetaceae bacterium]